MTDSFLSRRKFLQGTAVTSAALWTPNSATAGTANNLTNETEIGVSKWDLDTPVLCVDLDNFEQNVKTMQDTVTSNGIDCRPHAKTHKCPTIARLQIANGALGICTAKVSESEIMFEHGVEQILQTTANVTPAKIKRAMNLRRQCSSFVQATYTEQNARMLSEAAAALGIVADVVVDIDPGGHRTGITAGQPALALAQLVDSLPNLNFQGILCYDGGAQHVSGFEARRTRAIEGMSQAAESYAMMTRAGLNMKIFSGGGTGTYNMDHETPGFTDVQSGSYIFMDTSYRSIGSRDNNEIYTDFAPSLTIVTTVLTSQYEGRATTDAGAKSCTINRPWPSVVGETGMSYTSGSDEFGTIRYENPSRTYQTGETLELVVSHCDPVVNLYDRIYATRNDQVEAIWPIAARGKNQ